MRDNLGCGVVEPAISKIKSLRFATEAAITILRIGKLCCSCSVILGYIRTVPVAKQKYQVVLSNAGHAVMCVPCLNDWIAGIDLFFGALVYL